MDPNTNRMLITTFYVNVSDKWMAFGICLLLYWNAKILLGYAFVYFLWVLHNTYVYGISHLLAHLLIEFGTLPINSGIDTFQSNGEYGYMLASTAVQVLCARSAITYWTGSVTSSVVLGVAMSRLRVWVDCWERCTGFQNLRTVLWCIVLMTCYVLQWAYYATLPIASVASDDSIFRAYTSQNTLKWGHVFMWYVSIVNRASDTIQIFLLLVSCFQHYIGYRLLTWCLRKIGHPRNGLEDTLVDSNSVEFTLACRYVYALLTTLLAWTYSPRELPLVVQGFILIMTFITVSRGGSLRAYRQILHELQDAPAVTGQACGICLDDFTSGEAVKRLPCGHAFHGRCVRRWLHSHNDCPICRRQVYTHAGQPPYSQTPAQDETALSAVVPHNVRRLSNEHESRRMSSAQSSTRQLPPSQIPDHLARTSARNAVNLPSTVAPRPTAYRPNTSAILESAVQEVELKLLLATKRRREALEVCQRLHCTTDNAPEQDKRISESQGNSFQGDNLFQDEPLRLKSSSPPYQKRARSTASEESYSHEVKRRNTRDASN